MEYLQYENINYPSVPSKCSFKPYYKWNTFNTDSKQILLPISIWVLNLIINGIPSILKNVIIMKIVFGSFKPYYKWNTFNTETLKYINRLASKF